MQRTSKTLIAVRLLPALLAAFTQLAGCASGPVALGANRSAIVQAIAFVPDSRSIAASTTAGIMFFDLESGRARPAEFRWRGGGDYRPAGVATSLAYSPDGRYLAAAGLDGTVILWESDTLQEVETYRHFTHALTVGFSPDSRFLAMGSHYGTIAVADLQQPGDLRKLQTYGDGATTCLIFTADGGSLLAGGGDGITLWDLESQTALQQFDTEMAVSDCEISHADRRLVALAGDRIVSWQLDTDRRAHSDVEVPETIGEHLVVYGILVPLVIIAFAAASGGGATPSFSTREKLNLTRIALAPDGDSVLAMHEQPGIAHMFSRGFTQVIDIETGEVTATLLKTGFNDIAFSRDGRYIAVAASNGLRLFDSVTLQEIDYEYAHEKPSGNQ